MASNRLNGADAWAPGVPAAKDSIVAEAVRLLAGPTMQ